MKTFIESSALFMMTVIITSLTFYGALGIEPTSHNNTHTEAHQ